jgi:hypothetical protein
MEPQPRKVAGGNRKSFLLFSHGYTSSSWIRRFGNLPDDIFHIIHSYLSHFAYRQFVNASKLLFSDVKYETVYYDFIEVHEWKRLFPQYSEKSLRDYCKQMIQHKVKKKGIQVGMKIDFLSTSEISMYSGLYQGIHSLVVDFDSWVSSIQKFGFQDIYKLELRGCEAVRSLDEFLQLDNIHVLTLSSFLELVDISRLRKIEKLKTVELYDCPLLEDISALKDVNKLSVRDCQDITDFLFLENHESVTFINEDLSLTSEHFSHLKMAENIYIAGEIVSCSSLEENTRILKLTLLNTVCNYWPFVPLLPGLVHLYLEGCDLSLWATADPLLDLRKVFLRECIRFSFVPFQNVQVLKLEFFVCPTHALNFSRFSRLQVLHLASCDTVTEIVASCHLKELIIDNFSKLEKIRNVAARRQLKVSRCELVSNIEGLSSIKSVTLQDLSLLHDWSILIGASIVILRNVSCNFDGSFIQHAKQLTLDNCVGLSNLSIFGNLDEINIYYCKNVQTLKGLENVRKIYVQECPLLDLEGISNNQEVRLFRVSKELVEEFNHGKYSNLKEMIPKMTVSEKSWW